LPEVIYRDDNKQRDDSHRLRVFLAARARMLAERDTLVGPPGPVEMLCDELARTARWAHTVESQERDAPAQAERRWRAEQQDGPARLTMGTPARRRRSLSTARPTAAGSPLSRSCPRRTVAPQVPLRHQPGGITG
jgi:hypothetical protein